ncbi:MAG TPA: hypothetical protein PLD37_11400, partial [Usitatibacteraceae bacterium]|nr:hypothetical protein [Usitatibacteraceae bacterium]
GGDLALEAFVASTASLQLPEGRDGQAEKEGETRGAPRDIAPPGRENRRAIGRRERDEGGCAGGTGLADGGNGDESLG